MNTALASVDRATLTTPLRFTLRILALETRADLSRLLRTPAFSVPTLLFPVMFYLLFGVMTGAHNANPQIATQIFARFVVFGVMAPGLFGTGVTLAMDRERGLLELKRALPLPSGIYLAAKLITAMLLSGCTAILLMLFAATLGHVVLLTTQWGALLILAIIGVLPFCAIGLVIGSLVKGTAAPAIINLIYLPMAFLSGVLMPLSVLPHVIAQLAPLWPTYHLAGVAMHFVEPAQPFTWSPHLITPVVYATLFFALARHYLRKRN